MPELKVNFDVLSPVKFLIRSAEVYPDKVAVVYGDERYTYRQFYERVNRLASALISRGIGKGDKVAFVCPNTPPMLEAHYAVPMIGAALVSVNIRLSFPEVNYILDHSDAKAVFVDNEFGHLVSTEPGDLPKVETLVNICDLSDEKPLNGPSYSDFLATGSPEPVTIDVDDEYQVATINYTSGTTGRPKGVMYHHRGAYLNAIGEMLECNFTHDSVYLWTLPMFHCNGWCFTWGVTAMAGTHVCLRQVAAGEIFRLIETEGVSHLCAAPTVLITMANYPGARDYQMPRRMEIMTAGAPPSPTIIQTIEAMGANITHTYGLTEVYGPHSVCAWKAEWNDLPLE
ncbi:MAG: AMP-binding protein, partial [Desulfobacteraceae bacterium]|nr:AMP-binding protein [Desulfobacteraceae bacterium]